MVSLAVAATPFRNRTAITTAISPRHRGGISSSVASIPTFFLWDVASSAAAAVSSIAPIPISVIENVASSVASVLGFHRAHPNLVRNVASSVLPSSPLPLLLRRLSPLQRCPPSLPSRSQLTYFFAAAASSAVALSIH
ncbi:hypothetical protein GGX14DRAFT_697223 [Mycena pura]|uniref:Uncharacterized protein n=1 Tax=Mycena pura TaxID=153505 RepID=A0AAD6VKK6_9AGAR|nr:hypothetical protein GGX14DRAFT_697223 [Mycena pura]